MKTKYIISFIALFIIALTIISCDQGNESSENESSENEMAESGESGDAEFLELKDEQVEIVGIEADTIEKRSLSSVLKVNGMLEAPPQNLHSINAPYGGFIKETEMLEGSNVRKGQVIAVLEHPDYIQMQQEYMNSVSQLTFLEKDLERQRELHKGNATAVKVLQKSESKYNSMLSVVKGLEAKFSMLGINKDKVKQGIISSVITLRSPINGYITKVNGNIGKYVSSQDVIFEIVNTEDLHLELTVFEKDIGKIRVGQKIRFSLANEPNIERTATVFLIGKSFDDSRSAHVIGHLDKVDPQLLPGMYINAVIELGDVIGATVPREAVVMSEGKKYVFVKNIICIEHPECSAHENCPLEENCKEHPDCELHEKIALTDVDNENPHCEAHENCKNKSSEILAKEEEEAGYQTFSRVEVETGVANKDFIAIAFMNPVDPKKKVVTKGAFFLLSQSKTGTMDACGQ